MPVTCKSYKAPIKKKKELSLRQHCPFISYLNFGCHGNKTFHPRSLETICNFPTPVKLHLIFDCIWPTYLTEIQVRKCGRMTNTCYSIKSLCDTSAKTFRQPHKGISRVMRKPVFGLSDHVRHNHRRIVGGLEIRI